MFNAAKKENLTLIINSSYRSYEDQEKIYNDYSSWYGETDADKKAARPGYSEHQTGLVIDIDNIETDFNNFENTEEFKWMQENAHKYVLEWLYVSQSLVAVICVGNN